MHTRIVLKFVEKYKCPGIAFYRGPDVSNEQSCLKSTRLYDDLLLLSSSFHFFYLIFSAPISLSFPIFSNIFQILFFDVLSQALIKCIRKAFVCGYLNMCNICILENMNFCLTKKIMTFWFYLSDLVWVEC